MDLPNRSSPDWCSKQQASSRRAIAAQQVLLLKLKAELPSAITGFKWEPYAQIVPTHQFHDPDLSASGPEVTSRADARFLPTADVGDVIGDVRF